MSPEAGDEHALAAIAAFSGIPLSEVKNRFWSAMTSDETMADPAETEDALRALVLRVELVPIPAESRKPIIRALKELLAAPPPTTRAELSAWRALTRDLPPGIVTVDRAPVVLPAMPAAQEAAWDAILDLDRALTSHWCLIGGQMVAFLCAEHEHAVHRTTADADIVVDVWLEQRSVPTTTTGRRGLEVAGGNQALIRAERVPVRLGSRVGYVRRPSLLGALVAKAAAALSDSRDTDRHHDDIAVLGQIAVNTGQFRAMARAANNKDRKRLRRVLDDMSSSHNCWLLISEPDEVGAALRRLSATR